MAKIEVAPGMAVEVQEFGDGPPLVFLHGGAMTHRVWDHQVAALLDRFRCVAIDLRGTGGSDRPPSGYSVDVFAADVTAVCDALELSAPILVGHGLGSHVALRAATTTPGRFAALALLAAAPWFVGDRGDAAGGFPDSLWDRMRSAALTDRAGADLDLIDDAFFHEPPSEAMRAWCLSMALEWPTPVFALLATTLADVDHRDALPSIDIPVLLLHGRHDHKTRYEGVAELVAGLPYAEVITLDDSAHCPHLEQPQVVTEALATFAKQVAAVG